MIETALELFYSADTVFLTATRSCKSIRLPLLSRKLARQPPWRTSCASQWVHIPTGSSCSTPVPLPRNSPSRWSNSFSEHRHSWLFIFLCGVRRRRPVEDPGIGVLAITDPGGAFGTAHASLRNGRQTTRRRAVEQALYRRRQERRHTRFHLAQRRAGLRRSGDRRHRASRRHQVYPIVGGSAALNGLGGTPKIPNGLAAASYSTVTPPSMTACY